MQKAKDVVSQGQELVKQGLESTAIPVAGKYVFKAGSHLLGGAKKVGKKVVSMVKSSASKAADSTEPSSTEDAGDAGENAGELFKSGPTQELRQNFPGAETASTAETAETQGLSGIQYADSGRGSMSYARMNPSPK